jgi:FlaG/FlaF family flagellin (archaellin)
MGLLDEDRGATPLVGNVLLVAVAVVITVSLVVLSFAFLERTGVPTAEAKFTYEETPAGLKMTPQALGTDVTVELNGRQIATVEADSAGQSVLVPTAPGDEITVVSTDEDRSVLIRRKVDDRSEVGDFIAYYTFEAGSGTTLEDRSGNGNDGSLSGNPTWVTGEDGALAFDGSNDYVSVTNINAPVDVQEFTIAVAYRQQGHGSDDVSQLVEHTWSGNEWFLETRDSGGTDPYRMEYAVEFPSEEVTSGTNYEFGERHVAVGTYDGDEYALYIDGSRVNSDRYSRKVDMGDMRIGRDFESNIQYLDGEIYEIRLYYTAFDGEQVELITAAMS